MPSNPWFLRRLGLSLALALVPLGAADINLKVTGGPKALVGVGLVAVGVKGDDVTVEILRNGQGIARLKYGPETTSVSRYAPQVYGYDQGGDYILRINAPATFKAHLFIKNKKGIASFLLYCKDDKVAEVMTNDRDVLPPEKGVTTKENPCKLDGPKGTNGLGTIVATGLEP
jgi:hypothetical protein